MREEQWVVEDINGFERSVRRKEINKERDHEEQKG